jgi:hypothetical protein
MLHLILRGKGYGCRAGNYFSQTRFSFSFVDIIEIVIVHKMSWQPPGSGRKTTSQSIQQVKKF